MKKFLALALAIFVSTFVLNAQDILVPEPDFNDITYLLTSNTDYIKLPRETGKIRTKAGASLYLFGVGKVKTRLTLKGKASKVSVPRAEKIRLIIKATNNDTDPSSFINIFPFDIYKNKKRRVQLSEAGTFSGSEVNSLGIVNFSAKKYGESSYLLILENLPCGEYGISIGDPDNITEKNSLKVTTFGVTED